MASDGETSKLDQEKYDKIVKQLLSDTIDFASETKLNELQVLTIATSYVANLMMHAQDPIKKQIQELNVRGLSLEDSFKMTSTAGLAKAFMIGENVKTHFLNFFDQAVEEERNEQKEEKNDE